VIKLFGSLITALCTPFTKDLKIDYLSLKNIIDEIIRTGTDSIVVLGTTAESPTLTYAEKIELLGFVKSKVANRVKLIAGTGSNSTSATIAFTKEAKNLGYDGIMLVTPYYNKPSLQGIYKHFLEVAKTIDLPIMIYNIPGRTSVNLDVNTMVKLSKIENIVAFKEASGNISQILELIAKVDENVLVYSGDDALTLPVLSVGGKGVVSVASHLVGKKMKEMLNSYFKGDVLQAKELHQNLLPIFTNLFLATNPVPLKYFLSKKGLCEEYVRLPLCPLEKEQREILDKYLAII